MPSHRNLRMAEAIREVVASAILFEVADPRIQAVTVLRVEVSADLRQATVYVSVMGTEAEQKLAMRGLKHAAGFLQSQGRRPAPDPVHPGPHLQARRQREEVGRDLPPDRRGARRRIARPGRAEADPAEPTTRTTRTPPEADEPHDDVATDPA